MAGVSVPVTCVSLCLCWSCVGERGVVGGRKSVSVVGVSSGVVG